MVGYGYKQWHMGLPSLWHAWSESMCHEPSIGRSTRNRNKRNSVIFPVLIVVEVMISSRLEAARN